MRIIAVDWSGALLGAERKIWLAEVSGGELVRLEDGRSRVEIAEHLILEAAHSPKMIVGLDFAFSLPEWFLRQQGFSHASELWALPHAAIERWLLECAPPFWGRPGKPRPDGLAALRYRRCELTIPAIAGLRPKSVFQVGGAGAVGTGSLRGMAILHRLRASGFTIWPYDPPGWPRVLDIYPRVLTGPVHKANAAARAAYLEGRYPDLHPDLHEKAAASDDAFDAAVSALVMAQHVRELSALPAIDEPWVGLEGLMWYPGWSVPAR